MGGAGSVVEVDETFIGRKGGKVKSRGYAHKNAVLSLVDRTSGQVRSFHVDNTSAADLVPIIRANVAKETAIMTDEAGQYRSLADHFESHVASPIARMNTCAAPSIPTPWGVITASLNAA
jgi:transposase-like protein